MQARAADLLSSLAAGHEVSSADLIAAAGSPEELAVLRSACSRVGALQLDGRHEDARALGAELAAQPSTNPFRESQ
jgi:hypothetical protein